MSPSDRNAWAGVLAFIGVCVLVAAGLFVVTESASAAYTYSCAVAPSPAGPGDLADDAIETRAQRIDDAGNCAAIVERLEAVTAQLSQLDSEDGATTAQRVSLAPRDRERLDLAWWGIWGIVGLMLVGLFAPQWQRAFAFWRGNVLGRG